MQSYSSQIQERENQKRETVVVNFLKNNIDFFMAPFANYREFNMWAKNNNQMRELTHDMRRVLEPNYLNEEKGVTRPLTQFISALMVETLESNSLLGGDETSMRNLLSQHPGMVEMFINHLRNPVIDEWYRTQASPEAIERRNNFKDEKCGEVIKIAHKFVSDQDIQNKFSKFLQNLIDARNLNANLKYLSDPTNHNFTYITLKFRQGSDQAVANLVASLKNNYSIPASFDSDPNDNSAAPMLIIQYKYAVAFALTQIGIHAGKQKKYDKSAEYFQLGSQLSYVRAKTYLAKMHINNRLGEASDKRIGLRLLQHAAKSGHAKAQLTMAKMLKNGTSPFREPNIIQAREWYKQAEKNGIPTAQIYIQELDKKLVAYDQLKKRYGNSIKEAWVKDDKLIITWASDSATIAKELIKFQFPGTRVKSGTITLQISPSLISMLEERQEVKHHSRSSATFSDKLGKIGQELLSSDEKKDTPLKPTQKP
ncbi:MAG: sel1 repeat family protein [Gammaproteobacteria bacterium]|nr:sel1 repeat family protein [Gammaproteobacteria bacterium]